MTLQYNFVQVFGAGRLALSERPKIKEIKALTSDTCDRVITILAGRAENAHLIGSEVESCGMHWDWVKVAKITQLTSIEEVVIKNAIATTVAALQSDESVIIHCSAGLHRTGIFAYSVLRNMGMSHDASLSVIHEMRHETAEALDEQYLEVAQRFVL